MGRPSRNSRNNKSSTKATSSTPSPPPTRTTKRKAAPSPVPSPRGGNAKKIKVTMDDDVLDDLLPPPPPLPPQEEEEEEEEEIQEDPQATEKRQRIVELLRSAEDLPSAYAALKLVKENCSGGGVGGNMIAKRISNLSAADQALIHQASLAVPYLMYKLCVEEFTQPRAQGGLAYSHAKAVEVASILFEKAGPACCCAANITELQLVKKCSSPGGKNNNSTFTKNDARKVLPILKKIGIEARSKIDETIAKLEAPQLDETKVAGEEEPQEAPQQSNETKVTTEGKPQQEVAPADETKVGDDETKVTTEGKPQQQVPQADETTVGDDEAGQKYDL